MRRLRDDSGYATVAATGIIVAITALFLLVAGISSLVVARHRAQVAADLSAVAGAYALAYGDDACLAARDTAALNDARLTTCTPQNTDVVVTAVIRGREATARAGRI